MLRMSEFCDEAWARTAELRTAIHKLPFNVELAAVATDIDLTPSERRAYIVCFDPR